MSISKSVAATWFFVAVFVQGCSTSGSLNQARSEFFSGQPQAALDTLENRKVSSRDRLLALLDRGLIEHTAGDYQASIRTFKNATALLQENDHLAVREQTASLVVNDWVTSYKGEYSERLWIHTYQMMNFLMIGNGEGAAVEARQALKVYEQHGDALKNDWFTRALMAMSFEAAGKPDSAHIEYKKLLDDAGSDTGVARRAWQNAHRLGRENDAAKFKQLIKGKARVGGGEGELVVFLQTGVIPPKSAGEIYLEPNLYASFPVYHNYPRPNLQVSVSRNGEKHSADVINTQTVNISRAALAARSHRIATKQLLRIAAKRNLAQSVSKNDDILGEILSALFLISEQADTRSWATLPAHVSMIQIPLEAGMHDIELQVRDGSRFYELSIPAIEIAERTKSYRSYRVGTGAPRVLGSRNKIDTSFKRTAIPKP